MPRLIMLQVVFFKYAILVNIVLNYSKLVISGLVLRYSSRDTNKLGYDCIVYIKIT